MAGAPITTQHNHMPQAWKWWVLPALCMQALLLAAPLAILLITSFQSTQAHRTLGTGFDAWLQSDWTLHHYRRALTEPFNSILVSSVTLAAQAACVCLLIAFPVAWFLARSKSRLRSLWIGLFMVPFAVNFLVRIYAWYVILRPGGWVSTTLRQLGVDALLMNSRGGLLLGLVYGYLPFAMVPLFVTIEGLDDNELHAARDLGAGFWARLCWIILPHCRKGLVAAFLIVFIPMLGEYCVPRMLGGGLIATWGTQIEGQFLGGLRPNWPFGSALAVVLGMGLALCAGIWWALRLLQRLVRPGTMVRP